MDSKYQRIPRSESSDEDERAGLLSEHLQPARWCFPSGTVQRLFLIVSIILNVVLVVLYATELEKGPLPERSAFAGLTRTVPRPWEPLVVENDTDQEALWDATDYDKGNIALSDTYARSKGLPRAQRFPWDSSKGLYLINAYHALHCVRAVRNSIVEYHDNRTQSTPWGHVQHCLLVLRDEILCNADDTPRYTGFQASRRSGLGQVRMCRDFSQLEKWALENSACWRHIGDSWKVQGFREVDRYRFCPEGSPYKEMSETMWLESDWWKEWMDKPST